MSIIVWSGANNAKSRRGVFSHCFYCSSLRWFQIGVGSWCLVPKTQNIMVVGGASAARPADEWQRKAKTHIVFCKSACSNLDHTPVMHHDHAFSLPSRRIAYPFDRDVHDERFPFLSFPHSSCGTLKKTGWQPVRILPLYHQCSRKIVPVFSSITPEFF